MKTIVPFFEIRLELSMNIPGTVPWIWIQWWVKVCWKNIQKKILSIQLVGRYWVVILCPIHSGLIKRVNCMWKMTIVVIWIMNGIHFLLLKFKSRILILGMSMVGNVMEDWRILLFIKLMSMIWMNVRSFVPLLVIVKYQKMPWPFQK